MKTQFNKLLSVIALISVCMIGCEKSDNNPVAPLTDASMTKSVEHIRDVPIDAVFFNECCNEDVYITGTAHIMITANVIRLNISDQAGTGLTTGYTYTGVGQGVETNVFYWNQFEGTLTSMLNMSNGNGCSFRIRATFHITVTANGNTTANFETITAQCHP